MSEERPKRRKRHPLEKRLNKGERYEFKGDKLYLVSGDKCRFVGRAEKGNLIADYKRKQKRSES